eukprot:c11758_g1_i2.p2 GENE.c11758_g1_i2~~c11758_g1_i2.p2  ORF type:complete len:162 (+),score=43.48 c11758_g1_i2:774-1259(+)
MVKDVLATLDWIAANPSLSSLAGRLSQAKEEGRLVIEHDTFYTTPAAFTQTPGPLATLYAQMDLVIIKGDANYRRLLDDRKWPIDTNFEEFASFFPTRLLALRTCKSDVCVGVSQAKQNHARQLRPNDAVTEGNVSEGRVSEKWLCTGEFGVMQFKSQRTK